MIAGSLLFAAGNLGGSCAPAREPAYLADVLPGMLLSGIGVALVFPILAGAAVSGLPPGRTATGSALFNTARQIGGVVGVAVLVAILGDGLGAVRLPRRVGVHGGERPRRGGARPDAAGARRQAADGAGSASSCRGRPHSSSCTSVRHGRRTAAASGRSPTGNSTGYPSGVR